MFDSIDAFTIDDEATYAEWLWLSWSRPVITTVGLNLEPERSCSQCHRGTCLQRWQSSDAWRAHHIVHHYDQFVS